MILEEIPKFVINLKRRPDRLNNFRIQMEYLDWDFEVFDAIDTNSHDGVNRSILEIIELSKERGYKKVMIMEDDCEVMPYAKDLIEKLNSELVGLEYSVLNLSPTLNRNISQSKKLEYFLDMTNLPEKTDPNHREIYAANMVIYDESIYDEIFKIKDYPSQNGGFYYAMDDFIFHFIVKQYQSYCPIVPLCVQGNGWSDISHATYNNFYTQTYNWNLYSPTKIPVQFCDLKNNQIKIKSGLTEKL